MGFDFFSIQVLISSDCTEEAYCTMKKSLQIHVFAVVLQPYQYFFVALHLAWSSFQLLIAQLEYLDTLFIQQKVRNYTLQGINGVNGQSRSCHFFKMVKSKVIVIQIDRGNGIRLYNIIQHMLLCKFHCYKIISWRINLESRECKACSVTLAQEKT